MSDAKLPGLMELTPLNPAFNDDPHAILGPLRSACPVHRDPVAGVFIMSKYSDVRGTLSDITMWRGADRAEEAALMTRRAMAPPPEGLEVLPGTPRHSILTMDEPDHMRVREPLAKALYKRVARSKALVQTVVDEWLDRIPAAAGTSARTFDAMNDFAIHVPIDVIARLLGVDEARLREFREWSEGAILGLNPFRTPAETKFFVDSSNALQRYMRALMAERAADPRDDLVSDMMALKAGGRAADRGRDLPEPGGAADRRQPHHHRSDRQCDLAAADASRRIGQAEGRSVADQRRGGRGAAL